MISRPCLSVHITLCNMQTEMGKTKKRGYFCYPGLMFAYGLPYPPKTESVALGMYFLKSL